MDRGETETFERLDPDDVFRNYRIAKHAQLNEGNPGVLVEPCNSLAIVIAKSTAKYIATSTSPLPGH